MKARLAQMEAEASKLREAQVTGPPVLSTDCISPCCCCLRPRDRQKSQQWGEHAAGCFSHLVVPRPCEV